MDLLCCSKIQADRVYLRAVNKGDSKCIHWKNLRDLILAHPDVKRKVDVFALSVYSLVVFPKALDTLMKQSPIFLTDWIRRLH
ncbi:hypothetical protein Godav_005257 [Gossypium davidsonii]|uniref:Uncharacterized protein n=1 Tax=Gossypium davidsonii TaxID=34287 RepID=A0A7J8T9F8_GOSDV|nr:hypothetical protein [Gossypium davidsonii]